MENQEKTSAKKPAILKWSLIIGIIIVLNLFFNYAITLVYKAPVLESFYNQNQVVENIDNKEDCLKIGGQWNENIQQPQSVKSEPIPSEAVKGYCDPDFTNRNNYENANKTYEKNVFIILVALGVLSLLVGAFAKHEILSIAFSWGGVLSLIIASMRYWSRADNLLKVIILAVALFALVYVAIKKFSK